MVNIKIPYSLLPIPYSLFPIPYSLLPTPYSLLPILLTPNNLSTHKSLGLVAVVSIPGTWARI
ncbi:hypothetical protein F8S12_36085 [Nostoc sp. WHI]|nr:hypothetical protein [Nostoc sp. WHI]